MLYRVCVAAIVGFWLWMAGLLARTVWFHGDAPATPVPLAYVEHLIFRHEAPSDLVLYRQGLRADGSFHLQPKRLAVGDLLSTSGNFQAGLPGLSSGARVLFHGAVELDAHEQVGRIDLSVSVHEPKSTVPNVTLHLEGQPSENRWHYQLLQAGEVLREGSGTPAQLLTALDPHIPGLDPHALTQAAAARTGAVVVTAQRGKLRVNEDDIETYIVTIRQGEGFETTVHVNQVGQILAVKTFLGFDLYDETLSP